MQSCNKAHDDGRIERAKQEYQKKKLVNAVHLDTFCGEMQYAVNEIRSQNHDINFMKEKLNDTDIKFAEMLHTQMEMEV